MTHVFNRRDFMKVGGGAVALVALSRCGGNYEPSVGQFSGGNVADYAVGDIERFDAGPFFVVYDDGGFYAMSAVCTHQGCTINTNMICPCHGATYDLDGAVTGGPAPQDLDHYDLTIDDVGDITVDTGQVVSASSRTPVV